MEERDAIARLKHGDIAGLERLVREYQVRAECAAFLIVRDHALAEDIVQTCFLRVYDRIAQFDDARPFGPWFLRGVVNDAVKAAVRAQRQVSLDELASNAARVSQLPVAFDPGPHDLLEQAETREQVWVALGQLSPAGRAVVVQRYYLEMSEAEMAEELACSPGTIKSRLHGARRHLRRLLLPLWSGES